MACLPKGKTRFYYFKDRYALLLLSLTSNQHASKRDIRNSQFAQLLDKAVVRTALYQAGHSGLCSETFDCVWPAHYQCYFLTLGMWGAKAKDPYLQTSRSGFNLVLQLNFSSEHDEPYRRLVDADDIRPFEFGGHPVAQGKLHTLAWSRMDIDFATGEALIEEIQNDWVREAQWARRIAASDNGPTYYWGSKIENDRVIRYVDGVLRQHEGLWQEAILAATLWFLRHELGISNIYYHTPESGAELKSIRYSLPPRSIYSTLPRQFCFKRTRSAPRLLVEHNRSRVWRQRLRDARFFQMTL